MGKMKNHPTPSIFCLAELSLKKNGIHSGYSKIGVYADMFFALLLQEKTVNENKKVASTTEQCCRAM